MLCWKEGRGQKLKYRRLSSKNDLILCTNDATGHDMMQATIDINGDGSDNRAFSVRLNGKMEMSPQKHFLAPKMYRTEIVEA